MSTIPEPLRQQIEEAARISPDMNVSNNDDPIDDGPDDGPAIDEGPDNQ